MDKEFIFKYNMTEVGKAQGYFELNKDRWSFELVNASNAVGDLLKAMVSLLQVPAHLLGEENSTAIEWYSDEFIYVLEFQSDDGHEILLTFTRHSAPFGEELPPHSVSATVKLYVFYLAVIQELDRLIKRLGLLNYAQTWQNDEFPLTYFLTLKKYLIDWKKWKPSMEESDVLESEFMIVLS